ncbi:MAG: aldo/keto reductase [Clostridia bacterium]|nr:aldo/keto reductase [Clostridia bacterium]
MKTISPLTLGTVQLGMNYGISNANGQPDEQRAFEILSCALAGGITSLDTARAYGTAEEVLGAFFKTYSGDIPYITTKIPRIPEGVNAEKFVIDSVECSLEKLGLKKVDNVMLHSAPDVVKYGKPLANVMGKLVKMGYANQVGVSVYTAEDIENFLAFDEYTTTQIPMSIFDQRLIATGTVAKLRERNVTVFVRSVFLQGLFFLEPGKIEEPILQKYAVEYIRLLREVAKSENMSVAELAISFIRDTLGVTSLVLGAETPKQIEENILAVAAPAISESTRKMLEEKFACVNIPEIMKVLSRPKN